MHCPYKLGKGLSNLDICQSSDQSVDWPQSTALLVPKTDIFFTQVIKAYLIAEEQQYRGQFLPSRRSHYNLSTKSIRPCFNEKFAY